MLIIGTSYDLPVTISASSYRVFSRLIPRSRTEYELNKVRTHNYIVEFLLHYLKLFFCFFLSKRGARSENTLSVLEWFSHVMSQFSRENSVLFLLAFT